MYPLKAYRSLFITIVSPIYSEQLSIYWSLGDFGLSTDFSSYAFDINGSELFFKSNIYDVGISISTVQGKLGLEDESYSLGFCELGLFWSPLNINRYSILGPRVSGGFNFSEEEIKFDMKAGLSFLWSYQNEHLDIKIPLIFSILRAEIGYSVFEKSFYGQFSTDVTILFIAIMEIIQDSANTRANNQKERLSQ